jgi:glycosyltransferase involved in cell wall biosynthesis
MAVYAAADRVVFVTEEDRSAVCSELPTLRDTLIVPTAHEALDPGPGFDERAGLLLVGHFRHEPNLDALRWWHDEIGPLLAEMLPGVPLKVVGTDPGGKYAAPWAGEGIEVIGWVASTLPYLHSARLSVAPLRYGAGMKGKVGEALAAGLPVVGTPVAFEGMSLQHAQHVLVAATARAFAQTVAQAYFDRPLWERLRSAGRSSLLENFGTARMRHLVDATVAPATPGPATSGPAT